MSARGFDEACFAFCFAFCRVRSAASVKLKTPNHPLRSCAPSMNFHHSSTGMARAATTPSTLTCCVSGTGGADRVWITCGSRVNHVCMCVTWITNARTVGACHVQVGCFKAGRRQGRPGRDQDGSHDLGLHVKSSKQSMWAS